MAQQWQVVEGAAKNDAGEYQALVGGKWQPASGAAKSEDGKYMALMDAPTNTRSGTESIVDTGIDAVRGVVVAGESLVGIADLATGNLAGRGLASVGYNPKETHKILSSGYSDRRKEADHAVQDAKGFTGTVGALIDNPSAAFGTIVQSAPMTLTGAAAVRMAATKMLAGAGIKAGTVAAANFLKSPDVAKKLLIVSGASEGAMTSGIIQEQSRQAGRDYTDSVLPALAGGAITGAIGYGSSKIPGFKDAEVAAATAGMGATNSAGLIAAGKAIAKSAIKEGVLEELPQSAQEQVFTNLALGKPWSEGVGEAAAQGMVAGMGTGVGMTTYSEVANRMGKSPAPLTEMAAKESARQRTAVTGEEHAIIDAPNGKKAVVPASVLKDIQQSATEAPQTAPEAVQPIAQPNTGPSADDILGGGQGAPAQAVSAEDAAMLQGANEQGIASPEQSGTAPIDSVVELLSITEPAGSEPIQAPQDSVDNTQLDPRAVTTDALRALSPTGSLPVQLTRMAADFSASQKTKATGVPHAVIAHPEDPTKFTAVPEPVAQDIAQKTQPVARPNNDGISADDVIDAGLGAQEPVMSAGDAAMLQSAQEQGVTLQEDHIGFTPESLDNLFASQRAQHAAAIAQPEVTNGASITPVDTGLAVDPAIAASPDAFGGQPNSLLGNEGGFDTASDRLAGQPTPSTEQADAGRAGTDNAVAARIDAAAHEAATSPLNDLPEPTQAMKEAGNYKKAHVSLHGLDISIENPKGSQRSGIDPDGKPWSIELPDHYGYIKRTEGADGDHVDTYIGSNPESRSVFVVDQVHAGTGKFDEHKVMIGYNNASDATDAYRAAFNDGKGHERIGAVAEMNVDQFKNWLAEGDTKKPLSPQIQHAPAQKKAPAVSENLLARIKQLGGINMSHIRDVTGESNPKNVRAVGLFSKTGKGLDDLAVMLHDDGLDVGMHDANDNGGVNRLSDQIRSALDGNTVLTMAATGRKAAADVEAEHNHNIKEQAKALGIKTVARKMAAIEADVIAKQNAINSEKESALRNELEKLSVDLDAALLEAQSLIGEAGISVALRHAGEFIENNDIADERAQIRAMISAVQSEITLRNQHDEIQDTDARQVAEGIAGQSDRAGGIQAGNGENREGESGSGFELTGQSPAEIAAAERAQAAQDATAREDDAKAKAEQAKRDQDAVDAKVKARTDNADNFQFGESSKDAAKPEGDLFGQPEAQLAKVELTGHEFGDDLHGKELREAASAYARNNFVGKSYTNVSTSNSIEVTWQGIKHAVAGANDIELRAIHALPDILSSATFVSSEKDHSGRADIIAAHKYQAELSVSGEKLTIGVVVREKSDGHKFYDQFVLKQKTPTGTSEAASHEEKLGVQPSVGADVNVTQPAAESKPADKITLMAVSNKPFPTERAAQSSIKQRKLDATVVPVEGGFGIKHAPVTPADTGENAAVGEVLKPKDAQSENGKAAPAQPQMNTDDAGAELIANRRSKLKAGLNWGDIKDKEAALRVKEVVKSKVYLKPDYQAMIDSGMQSFTAHMVKQVYDSIAAKPSTNLPSDEQLQAYIDGVNHVMSVTMEWAKDKESQKALIQKGMGQAASMLGRYTSVLDMMEKTSAKSLMDRVYPDGWRNSRSEIMLLGGNRMLAKLQPGYDEARKALKEIDAGWPSSQEAWQKQGYKIVHAEKSQITYYADNDSNGDPYVSVMFAVNGKRIGYEIVKGAASQEDAPVIEKVAEIRGDIDGKYLVLNKRGSLVASNETEEAAIESAREQTKREGKEDTVSEKGIKVDNAQRIGEPRRMEGENISSEKVLETFGFKGVNFGNWMKGNTNETERQLHLNHIYDAFLDLAEILDVPPKAVSLNGMLGVAVGAQGNGGGAAAHFVPGVNEINLTREYGAGSLAHEWAHAVDHYFARQAGLERQTDPFLTEFTDRPTRITGEIRPEIVDRFKAIVQAMNKRQLSQEEYEERLKAGLIDSEKQLGKRIASVRHDFEMARSDSKKITKETALTKFDELAARIIAGDVGDGRVALGSFQSVTPVVDEMRNLYKQLTGRIYDKDGSSWLQGRIDSVRHSKELIASTGAHVPQMVSSNYQGAASKLDQDQGKSKPYWNTNLEKFARSFDAFVTDQLEAKNARNDYLGHTGRDNETVPHGVERETINNEFTALVQAIQSKETDRGVALFSKSGDPLADIRARYLAATKSGLSVDDVKNATAKLRMHWQGFRKVNVVQSLDDLPPDIRNSALRSGSSDVEGVYDPKTKQVFLVADNLRSAERAAWVAIHEVVGHAGLRMLDTKVAERIDYLAKNATVQKLAKAIATDREELFDQSTHSEEAVAELAAAYLTGGEQALFDRYGVNASRMVATGLRGMANNFVAAVRKFMSAVTGRKIEEVSDSDVRAVIDSARKAVETVAERKAGIEQAGYGKALAELDASNESPVFSHEESAPIPESEWLSDGAIAQIVEDRLSQFKHQPKILIRGRVSDVLGNAARNSDGVVSGMVHAGKVHLFKEGMGSASAVTRTLWHELLHYGIRRFMTKEQYIASMQKLYSRDAWIKEKADAWVSTPDADEAKKSGMAYARARGVDEALADIAEKNAGEDINNGVIAKTIRSVTTWAADLADRFGFTDAATKLRGVSSVEAKAFVSSVFGKLRNDEQAISDKWDFDADPAFAHQQPIGLNTPAQPGSSIPDETELQKRQRQVQDKMNRFAVLQKWLKFKGVSLSEKADVHANENLMHAKIANQTQDFRDHVELPLIERAAKAGFKLADIADYLEAQHIPEANARMRDIHHDATVTANGITDAEANQALADFQAMPKFAEFKKLADDFRAIGDETLSMRLREGLISRDQYDAYKNTYQHWVPLRGNGKKPGVGKGLSVNAKEKRRLGHGQREDGEMIIENLLMDRERAIYQVEHNRVGKSIIQFALEAKEPDMITVGKPEKRQVLKDQNVFEVQYKGRMMRAFSSEADAKTFINQAIALSSGRPGGGMSRSNFAIAKSNDPMVVMQASSMLAENEIQVYVAGHTIRVQLNDELLARAATNMGVDQVNSLLAAGRTINNGLSKIYTAYSPDFIFRNAIRDFIAGTINLTGDMGVKMAAKIYGNYGKAAKELFIARNDPRKSAWVQRYRAAGGNTGAAYLSDIERIGSNAQAAMHERMKGMEVYHTVHDQLIAEGRNQAYAHTAAAMKTGVAKFSSVPVLGHFLTMIEHLNAVTENALRLATYMTMVQNGYTEQQAASAAKNSTVNFNRKGEVSNVMGAAYLFFNPSVQGSTRMFGSLLKSEHKGQAQAMAGMLAFAAFALAELGRAGDDDDALEWKNIPEWTKSHNLIFKFGELQWTIPVPYEFVAFHALGNALSDVVHGESAWKASMKVLGSLVDNLSPIGDPFTGNAKDGANYFQIMPTVVKMVMGPHENQNSFSAPIQPEKNSFSKNKPDSQNMFRNTAGTSYAGAAEWVNEMTGGSKYKAGGVDVSPEVLKFWVATLTGGTGRFVVDMGDAAYGATQGVAPDLRRTPIARVFVREASVADARARFWEAANEAKAAADELSMAKRDHNSSAVKEIRDAEGDMIRLSKLAGRMGKAASKKRDAIDAIRQDDQMPLDQKREQMKEIEQKEREYYDRFLKMFDKAQKERRDKAA